MSELISLIINNTLILYSFVFFIGICIGSFLNVVIYRMPIIMEQEFQENIKEYLQEKNISHGIPDNNKKISLSLPRSACPSCGHKIKMYENIPIISWLFLKGQCSECHNKISFFYPFVEILTGVLFVFSVYTLGVNLFTLAFLLFVSFCIALFFIDLKTMYLPDNLTITLMWSGIVIALFPFSKVSLESSILGVLVGYLFPFIIVKLASFIFRKDGMGMGDLKLLAAFGAWFGWQGALFSLFGGAFVGLIFGGIFLLFKNKQFFGQQLPFGPSLITACLVYVLFNGTLNSIYQQYLLG